MKFNKTCLINNLLPTYTNVFYLIEIEKISKSFLKLLTSIRNEINIIAKKKKK